MTCTEEYKEHYRNFVCSKFYSLVLSCTARVAPQPHKRAKTAGALAVSYLCAARGICPTQGGFGRGVRVNQM